MTICTTAVLLIISLSCLVPSLIEAVVADGALSYPGSITSPQCWLNALQQVDSSTSLGPNSCTDPILLKGLALELVKCHLADLRQATFVDNPICEDSQELVTMCQLRHLTNIGIHTYTHFYTHVYDTCLRLTTEVTLQRQQWVTDQLTQTSHEARTMLQTMIQEQQLLHLNTQQREIEMMSYQKTMLNTMKEQWTVLEQHKHELESHQQDLHRVMIEAQGDFQSIAMKHQDLVNNQTNTLQERVNNVFASFAQGEQQRQVDLEEWQQRQQKMIQEYTLERKRQKEHVAELKNAANSVLTTMMAPLTALNDLWWIGVIRTILFIMSHVPFSVFLTLVGLVTIHHCRLLWIVLIWAQALMELVVGQMFWTKCLLMLIMLGMWCHNHYRQRSSTDANSNNSSNDNFNKEYMMNIQATMMREWKQEMEALMVVKQEIRQMEQRQYMPLVAPNDDFIHVTEQPLTYTTVITPLKPQSTLVKIHSVNDASCKSPTVDVTQSLAPFCLEHGVNSKKRALEEYIDHDNGHARKKQKGDCHMELN